MIRYKCDESDASRILNWLRTRGGILRWQSVNLSNPGGSWTTPAKKDDGSPQGKPTWEADDKPMEHITNPEEVGIVRYKELKRFRVGIRRSGNGLSYKVTDAGTRQIHYQLDKLKEKHGPTVGYRFDYSTQQCVIEMEESVVRLDLWAAEKGI